MLKKFLVEQGKVRLDKFLAGQVTEVSRSRIQKDIEAGRASVNGEIFFGSDHEVSQNDSVEYDLVPEDPITPSAIDLNVVYENKDLLVIDKPAGLVVHPAPGYHGDTVAGALLTRYGAEEIGSVGDNAVRPGIVHRLDKDTSGVMVIAKNQASFDFLKEAFAGRKVNKEYIALVAGWVKPEQQTITAPIGRHPGDFRKMATQDAVDAKEAVTEYQVEGYYKGGTSGKVDEYALIRVKLHTGRTHQIRVHMASLGHPIVGDALYGDLHGKKSTLPGLKRQFLHAEKIEIQMPDGTVIEAHADLPQDLQKALVSLTEIS